MSVEIPERDGDGFLKDMNQWNEDVMYAMAEADSFNLTDEAKGYIMKAREMFEESQAVPAVRIFAKELGMDRKAKGLYDVFESGPMKKIAKYGGLPKPTGCV
jgi:TusE/DsrC/DsvC family sulfur relay protein